jgi:hypothetical protein
VDGWVDGFCLNMGNHKEDGGFTMKNGDLLGLMADM